jgi:DNA-binding NarL/FixJ family response regulator
VFDSLLARHLLHAGTLWASSATKGSTLRSRVALTAAGQSNLTISNQTVRVHTKNIFAKLGVSDRTETMNVAIRRGIIHID